MSSPSEPSPPVPTLHLVFASPHAGSALQDALRAATTGDTLLLLQDGVYAAVGVAAMPAAVMPGVQVRALDADLRARGIGGRLAAGILPATDDDFVALTETHARVASWF
ncbi:MAG: sulfurtransferase complex subunit TusB [Pseudomonadota bacterium]